MTENRKKNGKTFELYRSTFLLLFCSLFFDTLQKLVIVFILNVLLLSDLLPFSHYYLQKSFIKQNKTIKLTTMKFSLAILSTFGVAASAIELTSEVRPSS